MVKSNDYLFEGRKTTKFSNEENFIIIMGQSPPSSTYNTEGLGLPFFQGNADFGPMYPMPSKYCTSPKKKAQNGDILISVRAPVGEVNIANQVCCIGRGLAAIRSKTNDNLFLYYSLLQAKNAWVTEKTTFEGIKSSHIENKEIFWPPKHERDKITSIFSTIDQAIDKADTAIEKTERIKQGLMQKLFAQGTDKARILSNWKIVNLSDVCIEIKRGPFGGSIKKEIFVPKGYKVYEQKNVIANNFSLGKYYIDENKYKDMKAFAIQEGDVLLTGAGTIGKLAIVPRKFEPGIINQALIKIRVNEEKMLIRYFYYLFNHADFQKKVLGSSHGATMKNISSIKNLKSLKLPLPPLERQNEIIDMLGDVDSKLFLENRRKEKLQRIKQSLMNDLLTGKKRIKV